MLSNLEKNLINARANKYAIGGFNTSNLEITQGILEGASKLNSPVIIQISEKAIKYAGLENLTDIVKNEAKNYEIAVSLHLDHAKSLKLIKRCLMAGFTSIMYDGSDLEFSENVKNTIKVRKLTKKFNALCEAELGTIGGIEDNIANKNNFTDPEKAKEFVEKTKVDILAVSFGNAHGIPTKNEELDFELLSKVCNLVKIPLVFHGASSTKNEDIKKAIELGIAKINIDTDIRIAFSDSIKKFQANHPNVFDPREILSSSKDAVAKLVGEKIKLFSSNNKN